MKLFDLVPGWLYAALLAVALALVGWQEVRVSHALTAVAEARTDLADYKATAQESARLAARAALLELERVNSIQRKALDDSAQETRIARDDRDTASAAAAKLRAQAKQFASRIRAALQRTAALESSAAGSDPIGVLTDVLGRCDTRVQRLAEIADASRIAGKLCERSYDALQAPVSEIGGIGSLRKCSIAGGCGVGTSPPQPAWMLAPAAP